MKKYRKFTEEERLFIEETIVGRRYAEVEKMFNERFSPPVTARQIRIKCRYHGIVGAKKGVSTGYRHHAESSRYKAVGSETVMLDGYTKVKTENGRWVGKHVLIWEGENGKVPDGHQVIFADSDKNNFALDNLLLVSVAEAAVMNVLKLRSTDPNMTRLGHAMAKMRIIASKRAREEFKVSSYSIHKMKEEKRLKREGTTQ